MTKKIIIGVLKDIQEIVKLLIFVLFLVLTILGISMACASIWHSVFPSLFYVDTIALVTAIALLAVTRIIYAEKS